jgi:hypothetical protein
MKNRIYCNVAVINNVNEILLFLLNRITESKLYDYVDKIFIIINGDINKIKIPILEKYEILQLNNDINKCEFPTLDLIWQHSKYDEFNLLYIHTKGVTKPYNEYIQDWVEYLTFFNIDKWSDRLFDLINYDTSGVNLLGYEKNLNKNIKYWINGNPPLHYSGNFWWSKSSHIKKLNTPYNLLPENDLDYLKWRILCEMWLCHKNGNFYEAFNSNVNHYKKNYKKINYEF